MARKRQLANSKRSRKKDFFELSGRSKFKHSKIKVILPQEQMIFVNF